MKAISLWQPWASLCVLPCLTDPITPVKPYETRDWPCPEKYIGKRVAIHAARRWTPEQVRTIQTESFMSKIMRLPETIRWQGSYQLPLGCIVGTVEIEGCWLVANFNDSPILARNNDGMMVYRNMPTGDTLAFGDFSIGRYAWALRNPVMFQTPIPYKGAQGWFNVPDEVVAEQMAKAASLAAAPQPGTLDRTEGSAGR